MLNDFTQTSEIDVLERVVQYAGRRHELIVHNIANLSTPNFQPANVDPGEFRRTMAEVVEKRRGTHAAKRLEIQPSDTSGISFHQDTVTLSPRPSERNIMFHDRNDRDLERTMQSMTENVMMYRQAVEFLRSKFNQIRTAIRGRI